MQVDWQAVMSRYTNLDDAPGGRLQHVCGEVIASANLNRETLELLAIHDRECESV